MNPRGHREIAAVVMLLALVLSAIALIPASAQAATNTVTGLVNDCDRPTTYVGGATVTLNDANGVLTPSKTTTATDGTFSFTPPAANYTISVTAAGYYGTGPTAQFRFDGTTTVTEDLCLTRQLPQGKTSFVTTFHVQDASTSAFIGGATVSVYNNSRQAAGQPALVSTAITNGTAGANQGNVYIGLWDDTFLVRVNATGYGVYLNTMTIASAGTVTIPMTTQFTVVGHARNAQGQFLSAGLTGTLYSLSVSKSNVTKLIPATVSGSLFTFYAPAGTYRMVIDANGYSAYHTDLTLSGAPATIPADATLSLSPQEPYLTTVQFGSTDWNNITVYRNWTLNPDSSVPGLNPAGFRDLRQQINYTFGTGASDGTVSAGDIAGFRTWLRGNGPLYVTTDAFLLVNLKSYNSTMTSFTASVSNTLPIAGAKVWVNTTTTYHVKSTAWITYGAPKYFLNMTLYPDTNTSVYHNETYIVQLPRAYEMASSTSVPSGCIATTNYTRITVDPVNPVNPACTSQPIIRMTIQQSFNGTARAQVTDPPGKFYVVNSAYQSYQAYVAGSTDITFSAAQSSDPVGDITKANFTWEFQANTNPAVKGWGITSVHKYTTTGQFTVNLTVVQAGGNITYRDITVWVDGVPPTGNFKTNYTGSGSAIGLTLRINESTQVRFDGSLSTDLAYTGKAGIIPNSGWAWDFDGDHVVDTTGRVANKTFDKPGYFNVTLNVTDSVGWKGTNVTMVVIVNDTRAPVPAFSILDPSNDFAPVSEMIEGHNYSFNASSTTDNYNNVSELDFNWTIPGPVIGSSGGTNTTLHGENVTVGWTSWNLTYAIKLTVKDRGFGSGTPNAATKTFNESVNIDPKQHPDLLINVGTMKLSSTSPEGGQSITITLNVTNKANRGSASQVYVSVSESGTSLMNKNNVGNGWTMVDRNGNAISNTTIPSGTTVTIKVTVTVTGQGNKTLAVVVADAKEPYTWVNAENTASLGVNVNQPAWVTYAIVGAIVAVFLVVIGAMYYRRKVKAGDWQPRLRRSKEEGGKEKPRKEKEVKEEKKRL